MTSSPFFIPSHIPTPNPRRTAARGNWVMCSRHESGRRFSISWKSASGPLSASLLPNFDAFSLMGKSKSMPAADRSWLSSGVAIRGPLSLVLVAVAPPQQQPDYESDADRDQERLAGIGSDVAADLIGDLAEIGVFDLLPHAV